MNTSGPGKSNMDNFIPLMAGEFGTYFLSERDAVIIDLRGSRYSDSFLKCDELIDTRRKLTEQNLSY